MAGRIKEVADMNAIRKEILEYIENIPDSKLESLKPVLAVLANLNTMIETDLTDEERTIAAQDREESK